jgi:hypothetical protein
MDNLPSLCISHSGADPVYRSAALERRIPIIQSLTFKDSGASEKMYWRRNTHDGWRRLRLADYPALNRAIEDGLMGDEEKLAMKGLDIDHYPGKWKNAKEHVASNLNRVYEDGRHHLPYWERVRLYFLELGGCYTDEGLNAR